MPLVYENCLICNSLGNVPCDLCKGTGKFIDNKCFKCNGIGRQRCETCKGTGKVAALKADLPKSLNINFENLGQSSFLEPLGSVFISYNRQDQERVRPIVTSLRNKGFNVWWDVDIQPATDWLEETKRALNNADCVVVVWSKNSIESGFVYDEAKEGFKRKILVPVRIDLVEAPLGLGRLQYVDLSGQVPNSLGTEFTKLVNSVRTTLQRVAAKRDAKNKSTTVPKDSEFSWGTLFWLAVILFVAWSGIRSYLGYDTQTGTVQDIAQVTATTLNIVQATSQVPENLIPTPEADNIAGTDASTTPIPVPIDEVQAIQIPADLPGHIAFVSDRDENREIYYMRADGTNVINLTRNSSSVDEYPSLSPDGYRIAYSRHPSGFIENFSSKWEIIIMNIDGSNVSQIRNDSLNYIYPTWMPNNRQLTFTTDTSSIQSFDIDSTTQITLADNSIILSDNSTFAVH